MVNAEVLDVKIEDIVKESGVDPNTCYQCGKCTAGCPLTFSMDYSPMVILRLLQIGRINSVLNSRMIWLCTSCETCSTRCPRGINVARLIDSLRIIARRKGRVTRGKNQVAFNDALLRSLRFNGRVYDTGILVRSKLGTGKLLKTLPLVLPVLTKGKIRIIPTKIKGRKQIGQIFTAISGRGELE